MIVGWNSSETVLKRHEWRTVKSFTHKTNRIYSNIVIWWWYLLIGFFPRTESYYQPTLLSVSCMKVNYKGSQKSRWRNIVEDSGKRHAWRGRVDPVFWPEDHQWISDPDLNKVDVGLNQWGLFLSKNSTLNHITMVLFWESKRKFSFYPTVKWEGTRIKNGAW